MTKIKAFLIFEMLGRPAEHLKKTLNEFVEQLGKEKDIEIKSKEIKEPKKLEEAKQELYTSFAETEIEFKDLASIFKIVFVYMPSHIEIAEPEELKIKNFDINILMNELVRRLHQYDELAKGLAIERSILLNQLKQAGIQPAISFPEQKVQQKTETEKRKSKKKKKK